MIITIPFRDDMKEAIHNGRKSATSRFERYGKVGDIFEVNGEGYILVEVGKTKLGVVASVFYDDEGFDSPEEFRQVWAKLHPRRTDEELTVWVHRFASVEEQ